MAVKKISKKNFKGISQTRFQIELDFLRKQDNDVLGDLSMDIVATPASFSFRQITEDKEFLKNPNILENNTSSVKNKIIPVGGENSELDNPIFDLDAGVPSVNKDKIQTKTKTKNIIRRVNATSGTALKRR